jgi:hypothetical protein
MREEKKVQGMNKQELKLHLYQNNGNNIACTMLSLSKLKISESCAS